MKRSLQITNNNAQPVAFKVKTTAPKVSRVLGVDANGMLTVPLSVCLSLLVALLRKAELGESGAR